MSRPWFVAAGAVLLGASFLATPAVAGPDDEKREEKIVREFSLVKGGGHLGVTLAEVDAQAVERLKLPEERGAIVRAVGPDSPADKAGLRVDDVIVRYQSAPIDNVGDLVRRVRETPPGRKVALEVIREGAPQKLSATIDEQSGALAGGHEGPGLDFKIPHLELPDLGELHHWTLPERPDQPDAPCPGCPAMWGEQWNRRPRRLGIEYQEIHGQLAEFFKVKGESAVLVTSVDPDGPAAKGLKAGDVIVKIGGDEVDSGRELRERLFDVGPGDEVAVTVLREGRPLDVTVTAGGSRTTHRHSLKSHKSPAAPEQPKAPASPKSEKPGKSDKSSL